jgi:transposase-like protein
MDPEIARRLRWVRMLRETGNAGMVCLRCGVSRPTLSKWARRYEAHGEQGLQSVSRRLQRSPNRKLTDQDRSTIPRLRGEGNSARRIQTELRLFEQTEFALATIRKVLTAANVKPLIRPKRSRVPRHYSRPIPGDRVQMDTMKVAPGV